MKPAPTTSRKLRVLYADDRPDNVTSLLHGALAVGLIPQHLAHQLALFPVDSDENIRHNRNILHDPGGLVEIDYATLISEAITFVATSPEPYDLIISDWYFGQNDPEFEDSQLGGIWIILWGQRKYREPKPVCKLYTAQQADDKNKIDFRMAKAYINDVYGIAINEVGKSETAESWQQHLHKYFLEVAQGILPFIRKSDLVAVINHIAERLSFSRFHNCQQDGDFEAFLADFQQLGDFRLRLKDETNFRLSHLFPLVLGRYLMPSSDSSLSTRSLEKIGALLYARKLIFASRDERNGKLRELQQMGINCRPSKEHNSAGNPIFVLQVESDDYYEGPLRIISNILTENLDDTFKVQSYVLEEQGLKVWLDTSNDRQERINFHEFRQQIILPRFQRISNCFGQSPMEYADGKGTLSQQIAETIMRIEIDDLRREGTDLSEKCLHERLIRAKHHGIIESRSSKHQIPLLNFFRINVHDFFTDVLGLEPLSPNEVHDEEAELVTARDFYWYCNAWLVREGMRTIVENMQGGKRLYAVMSCRNTNSSWLVTYKILLRDANKALASIARAFVPARGHLHHVPGYFKGFCDLRVRSRLTREEAVEYDVFSGAMEIPYPGKMEAGTEFEFSFTQRRDR